MEDKRKKSFKELQNMEKRLLAAISEELIDLEGCREYINEMEGDVPDTLTHEEFLRRQFHRTLLKIFRTPSVKDSVQKSSDVDDIPF